MRHIYSNKKKLYQLFPCYVLLCFVTILTFTEKNCGKKLQLQNTGGKKYNTNTELSVLKASKVWQRKNWMGRHHRTTCKRESKQKQTNETTTKKNEKKNKTVLWFGVYKMLLCMLFIQHSKFETQNGLNSAACI